MDFYVVADEDTVAGFRHAGVGGTVVRTAEEAAAELDRLLAEHAQMIIITTEQTADRVRDKISRIRYAADLPLIVEIPGPDGPSPDSPSLMKMIREAAGIRL